MTDDRHSTPSGNEPSGSPFPSKTYDEQARGPGRSERPTPPAVPSTSAPRTQRKTEGERTQSDQQGITDAAVRVDEDVEREQPDDAAADALEGEQTETRHTRGPRAAGADPDVS